MHAQESVLGVPSRQDWSLFNHGISLQKDIFQVQHALLPNLRHLREKAEDDILESEDAQGTLLVIEGYLG
jgi:hypothetical protein